MFWVMMYMLLFGNAANPGAALVPDAKTLRKAIEDPVREAQVLEVRTEADRIDAERRRAIEHAYTELGALNRRHDATTGDFEAVFAELDASRRSAQAGLLDARFALREHMTPKEWAAVYGKR